MIPEIRKEYNRQFTEAKYHHFLEDFNRTFSLKIPFRICETPVFVPSGLKEKLIQASEEIINFINRSDFKQITASAVPTQFQVPHETERSLFLTFDFAIVKNAQGELEPQLIELQGFPSLFGYQHLLASKYKEHFFCPEGWNSHFNLSSEEYENLLKATLLNGHSSQNVVLLEVDPWNQNTAIDFLVTEKITGIKTISIDKVIRDGRKLFYEEGGKRIPIHRIYNRVIFEELSKRHDLDLSFHLTDEVDVEWAGHPNWFFRISKYMMPFLKGPYVPESIFLDQLLPIDLENYVLKPLFSFSGEGVLFHLKRTDVDAIPTEQRKNFILQRKVSYESVVESPDGNVKVEIRLLFIWEKHKIQPTLVTNLARLSRGEMIGVKYNKDKSWVGSSICFFEP